MDRGLAALGRELATSQDAFIGQRFDLQRGRTRLLVAVNQPPPATRICRILSVAALLFSAAVIGYWLRGSTSVDRVGLVAGSHRIGEWIAASDNTPVPLGFTDGTKFELQPNGRARVTELAPSGATVVVERGELRASVRPRRGNQWRIDVGPFRVTVLGTLFDVSWQPEVERFSLTLRKGVVAVAGPVVGAERIVRAGEQLEVWVGQGSLKSTHFNELSHVADGRLRGFGEGVPSPRAVGEVPVSEGSPGRSDFTPKNVQEPKRVGLPVSEGRPSPNGVQEPKRSDEATPIDNANRTGSARKPFPQPEPKPWAARRSMASTQTQSVADLAPFRALARANQYRDALAEAERIGIHSLCSEGDSVDLLLLGDVARLAGNVAVAQTAYLTVRRRFGGIPAAQSAFMLGRIAHDQRGAFAESAEYFATYLREAPGGAFAREAASRLVESRTHAGDRDGAKAAAAQYLVWYPTGPYANKARELVAEP